MILYQELIVTLQKKNEITAEDDSKLDIIVSDIQKELMIY